MKKKMVLIGVALALPLVSLGIYLLFFLNIVNTNFATEATIRFSVRNDATGAFTTQEFLLTDEEDIVELKGIFRGRTARDSPACGFSMNVSITMHGRGESLTFCLALDGCSIIRVNDSDRFIRISDSQREVLDDIFARFGFTFPAI